MRKSSDNRPMFGRNHPIHHPWGIVKSMTYPEPNDDQRKWGNRYDIDSRSEAPNRCWANHPIIIRHELRIDRYIARKSPCKSRL